MSDPLEVKSNIGFRAARNQQVQIKASPYLQGSNPVQKLGSVSAFVQGINQDINMVKTCNHTLQRFVERFK